MRIALATFVAVIPLLCACSQVPPVSLHGFDEERFAGGVKLNAPDVNAYVAKYGVQGWLKGLSDDRTVEQAMSRESVSEADPYQVQHAYRVLRVKDLFVLVYARMYHRHFINGPRDGWPDRATFDAEIEKLREELRTKGEAALRVAA